MKNKTKLVLGTLLGCVVFSTTVYANSDIKMSYEIENSAQDESILLPEGVNQSVDYGNQARGTYISGSTLSISNKGYSIIGVYAATTAHVPVQKIRMNIYLDQWDEENQSWNQISYKQVVYEHEEDGDDLTSVVEAFDVEGCEAGYYYRLRGTHAVWPFEGSMEMHSTRTDGILLTAGPA